MRIEAIPNATWCAGPFKGPVPIEGIVKIALDLDDPEQDLTALLAVSLTERHFNASWQCLEYEVPATVAEWLLARGATLDEQDLRNAAEFQLYQFRRERHTMEQAMRAHQALHLAGDIETADRLVLDVIVGPMNRQGLYQTLLEEWLPQVCESEIPEIRGAALGQTGKQHYHLGNYETALGYYKQSLAIQKEIGDKSGEGTTLNNISGIYQERGDYETALSYLKQSFAIQQEIGDTAGLCLTLFNIGQIYAEYNEIPEAFGAWLEAYSVAKAIGLAQVLNELIQLADQLGLEGGLDAWEKLAQQQKPDET